MERVKELNENDILLGRGGKNNQWIGNERLRNMARRRCQDYQKASKKEKSQISREIVSNVRRKKPSGRFLRKCSASSWDWEDVGDEIAREKTSQVLRDALQARKSFSNDWQKCTTNDFRFTSEPEWKDPPYKIKKTGVKQPFQPTLKKVPTLQQTINLSPPLICRNRGNIYSPELLSLQHSCNSYGRVSIKEPRNLKEEALNVSVTSLPYQYSVTPASASIAASTGKKRQRFSHESPLVQGYHQYPYPTPIRRVDAPSTPPTSPLLKTPFQIKARGLTFSPPTLEGKGDNFMRPLRCISALRFADKKYVDESVDAYPAPTQISNKNPENRGDDNQEFDTLLTEEVLDF